MIEFHAGSDPDSQAIGIALEEMYLDYRLMPGRAPVPVIAIGGARVVGAPNVLMALARKTGRFLPETDARGWIEAAQPDLAALEAVLARSDYIAGKYSVADMALYPRIEACGPYASIARWASELSRRPALGRGLGVVAPAPMSGRPGR